MMHGRTTPIRALHCIHSLQGGGAERQLMLLVNESNSHGIVSAVACVDDAGRTGLSPEVPLYVLRRRRRFDSRLVFDALAAIDQFQPDVVHAWLPAIVNVPVMLAAWRRRLPAVFSYRTPMKNDAWFKPIEFLVAARCASMVVSNTEPGRCAASYRWLFRRKQGLLISNGVEANPRAADCMARTAHDGAVQLLFAGRLSEEKNWPLLLDAMKALLPRCNARLTICGRGEHQAQVERRITELGLEQHVDLVGYIPDLRAHMARFDALVMPSLWEGIPNVVLEAMAAGLPCILSDIPEHRSVCGCGDVAAYFDLRSSSSLVEAVCAVASDHARRLAMSDAGLRRSAEFSVAQMAAKHARAYGTLTACAA